MNKSKSNINKYYLSSKPRNGSFHTLLGLLVHGNAEDWKKITLVYVFVQLVSDHTPLKRMMCVLTLVFGPQALCVQRPVVHRHQPPMSAGLQLQTARGSGPDRRPSSPLCYNLTHVLPWRTKQTHANGFSALVRARREVWASGTKGMGNSEQQNRMEFQWLLFIHATQIILHLV